MTDFATLRRTDAAGFTGRVRREVVVVHVALARHRVEGVELLLHLQHVERCDTHDLGLATLEQCRTMCTRDDVDLGVQRTNVRDATAVDADLLLEDALTHDLLRDRAQGGGEFLLATFELLGELIDDVGLDCIEAGFAIRLRDDLHRFGDGVLGQLLDGVVGIGLVLEEQRELSGFLRSLRGQFHLRFAQDADELLRGIEALGHDLFGRRRSAALHEFDGVLGGFGFDHHDGDVVTDDATCDDHVEDGVLELLVRRERNPLAADECNAHTTDRAGERQTGELRRHRGRIDRDDVVQVCRIQ